MRYDDWDVLLFPQGSRVPIKEFRVDCRVVQDTESSHAAPSDFVPTVCCFVPSLAEGTPFHISLHSWNDFPPISQYTKARAGQNDSVRFSARLFIDGCLAASTILDRRTSWPHIISQGFEFSKNSDLEPLKFPAFPPDALRRPWNPAEPLGRIKIVIAEGLMRDPTSMPFEKVKNIVAFSFQYAPLNVLETSGIAWPNSSMWRRASQNPTVLAPPYQDAGAELHAHSPRRRMEKQPYFRGYETPLARKAGSDEQRFASPATVQGLQQASSRFGFAPGQFTNECATPSPGYDWPSAPSLLWGPKNLRKLRKSSTDTSMPDYVPSPGAGRCETVSRFEVQPGNLGSTGNNTDPYFLRTGNTPCAPSMPESSGGVSLQQPPAYQAHQYTGRLPSPEDQSRKETLAAPPAHASTQLPSPISPLTPDDYATIISSAVQSPGKQTFQEPQSRTVSIASNKRDRDSILASAKTSDEEDQAPRGYPRPRLTSYTGSQPSVVG